MSIRIPFFDERYLIGCSPFLYILCARGISAERTALNTRSLLAIALPSLLIFSSIFNYFFHPRFGKEQWREAVADVETELAPGEPILLDADFMNYPVEYYARKQPLLVKLVPEARDSNSPQWLAVEQQLAGHRQLWLMQSHNRDDLFFDRLANRYRTVSRRWYKKDKGIIVTHLVER